MKRMIMGLFLFVQLSFCNSPTILQRLSFQKPPQELFSKKLLGDIILRFYYVQRLSKAVQRLIYTSCNQLVPLSLEREVQNVKDTKTIIVDHEIIFTHPRIIWCVEHIEKYHSLVPLLEIWNDLSHYQFMNDAVILREFSYLLFFLYKGVIRKEIFLRNQLDAHIFDAILKRVPPLDAADIEDILDILDLLANELPAFIEKYELASPLTWKQWLKKYWLLAPLGLTILLLRAYLSVNTGHTSSDMSPASLT